MTKTPKVSHGLISESAIKLGRKTLLRKTETSRTIGTTAQEREKPVYPSLINSKPEVVVNLRNNLMP